MPATYAMPPHVKVPEPRTKNSRPWWASAFIGGLGLAVGVVGTLGLASTASGRVREPEVQTSTLAPALQPPPQPPGSISLDDRLKAIEKTLKRLEEAFNRIPEKCKPATLPPRGTGDE